MILRCCERRIPKEPRFDHKRVFCQYCGKPYRGARSEGLHRQVVAKRKRLLKRQYKLEQQNKALPVHIAQMAMRLSLKDRAHIVLDMARNHYPEWLKDPRYKLTIYKCLLITRGERDYF